MKKYLMLITAMFMLIVSTPVYAAGEDGNVGDAQTETPTDSGVGTGLDATGTEGSEDASGDNTPNESQEKPVESDPFDGKVTYTDAYKNAEDGVKATIDEFISTVLLPKDEYTDFGVDVFKGAFANYLSVNARFKSNFDRFKETIRYDYQDGGYAGYQFYGYQGGNVVVRIGDIEYATVNVKVKLVNVLQAYNFETEEELIEYIKKNITDSFELEIDELEVTPKEIPEGFEAPEEVDIAALYNKYFQIKINVNGEAITKDYLVEMYSGMGSAPVYYDEEANVGVYVDTEDELPTDLELKATPITKGMGTYAKIKDTIKTDNFLAFDINLYSPGADKYITKLETGTFLVELYLGEEYVGKDMTAYYIKEDGSLEAHPLEIDEEGYAYFETTHFSTYFITETLKLDSNNKVPNTVDNGVAYILAGTLGLVTMLGSAILISKRK